MLSLHTRLDPEKADEWTVKAFWIFLSSAEQNLSSFFFGRPNAEKTIRKAALRLEKDAL